MRRCRSRWRPDRRVAGRGQGGELVAGAEGRFYCYAPHVSAQGKRPFDPQWLMETSCGDENKLIGSSTARPTDSILRRNAALHAECVTASAGLIRRLEIASAKPGCRDGRSAGDSFWRAASHSVNRERHEPNVLTGLPRMLNACALAAAGGAKALCVKPVGLCQRGQSDFRFGAKSRLR
jgi:hypothetical protein